MKFDRLKMTEALRRAVQRMHYPRFCRDSVIRPMKAARLAPSKSQRVELVR